MGPQQDADNYIFRGYGQARFSPLESKPLFCDAEYDSTHPEQTFHRIQNLLPLQSDFPKRKGEKSANSFGPIILETLGAQNPNSNYGNTSHSNKTNTDYFQHNSLAYAQKAEVMLAESNSGIGGINSSSSESFMLRFLLSGL